MSPNIYIVCLIRFLQETNKQADLKERWFLPAQKAIWDSKANDENDEDGVRVKDDGGEVPVGGCEVAEEEEGEEDKAEEGEEERSHGGDGVVGEEEEKKSANKVAQGESKKATGGDKKGFLPSSSSHWYYQVSEDGEAGDGDGEDDEDDQQLGLDCPHNLHHTSFLVS